MVIPAAPAVSRSVQDFVNGKLAEGQTTRNVALMRQVLSAADSRRAALTRAVRQELISRNVARLTELPGCEPRELHPWSTAEALSFLQAARTDPLYPASSNSMI